jgi:hypothetical protein
LVIQGEENHTTEKGLNNIYALESFKTLMKKMIRAPRYFDNFQIKNGKEAKHNYKWRRRYAMEGAE